MFPRAKDLLPWFGFVLRFFVLWLVFFFALLDRPQSCYDGALSQVVT